MRTVQFGSTTRVLLVDDHTLMRDGLKRILKAEHGREQQHRRHRGTRGHQRRFLRLTAGRAHHGGLRRTAAGRAE
jgi:hypothetical protein